MRSRPLTRRLRSPGCPPRAHSRSSEQFAGQDLGQDLGNESKRPGIPGAGARDPGNAALSGPCRVLMDHLRLRRRRARLGLFRPRRHHRRRARQVSADGTGQGRRAGGDRQGRGHSRRQWRPCAGGRRAGRVRPLGGASRHERRARGARFRAGGNPAPQDRARERAVASLRCRSGDRLAGRRSAGVARAREPGSHRRSRTIGGERRLVRR